MDLKKLNELDLNDLGNIKFEDMADWPMGGRLAIVLVVIALVVGGGYWFQIKDKMEQLDRLERQEQTLRQQFESRQRRAANLEDFREQLEEMRVSFGAMLRQLPGRAEVEALLVDISQTASAHGLEQELFRPQSEQHKDFYAELPYRLRLVGDYHRFGRFADDVSKLPRIVTLHDIHIRPRQDDSAGLVMELVAKTYRYLDDEDDAE
jgi:type IV pilus assembly protein PilO